MFQCLALEKVSFACAFNLGTLHWHCIANIACKYCFTIPNLGLFHLTLYGKYSYIIPTTYFYQQVFWKTIKCYTPFSPSPTSHLCTLHCNHCIRTYNQKHFYLIYFANIDSMCKSSHHKHSYLIRIDPVCKSTNRLDRHPQRRHRSL